MNLLKFTLPTALFACTAAIAGLPPDEPVPGGITIIPIYSGLHPEPSVTYGRTPLRTVNHEGFWWAITGISLDTIPGEYVVSVSVNDEPPVALPFQVTPHIYPTAPEVPDQRGRLARFGSLLQGRDNPEKTDSPEEFNNWQSAVFTELPLSWPANGDWQDRFGYTEYLDFSRMRVESHVQLSGQANQLVVSPGLAIALSISRTDDESDAVRSATYDIVLDHGGGLISLLQGVSDLTIETGDKVEQGAMIGRMRSQQAEPGAGLRWQVLLNGVFVNPAQLTREATHSIPETEPVSFPWPLQEAADPAPDTSQ